ncbi:hypothetical protein PIB30_060242 [Stylosanthes scabra]|uniref:Uncharacterized protein n=1 Tax=Stylosanthes scabra TaxID=79078 RepID=A0ABU6YJE0_9FABA|nr:hypothetical protein [Stylosanthes scabra]
MAFIVTTHKHKHIYHITKEKIMGLKKNNTFVKLAMLVVLLGLTTTTVMAHHRFNRRPFRHYKSFDPRLLLLEDHDHYSHKSFDPAQFLNGDTYFYKSSTGAFATSRSTPSPVPPPELHHQFGEIDDFADWKACFCAGSYPPEWKCTDISDFFDLEWKNSFLFFKEEVFFVHKSSDDDGGDVPAGIKYFFPRSHQRRFP